MASLGALGMVRVYAHQAGGAARAAQAVLAVVNVAVPWFSVHTIFTRRFARLYYARPAGGIDFSQDEPPIYLAFAYLTLALGISFQVSDTTLKSSDMRGPALRYALRPSVRRNHPGGRGHLLACLGAGG
jgi:uncharacterized membrane protein